tara:strand:+ start:14383 stop:14613 length:231 start_codon:yes stop_codon:yes gene_type:complete
MGIIVNLDVMLAVRKMRSKVLASKVNITEQNISILKSGKAKAIRFSTLAKICQHLDCQPGDILKFVPDETSSDGSD